MITYSIRDGETVTILPGGRMVVAHPDREPFLIELDGTVTRLKPEQHRPPEPIKFQFGRRYYTQDGEHVV